MCGSFYLHFVSADMTDDTSQINTFAFSNIAPQYRKHNQVAWKNLEAYTRTKASEKGPHFYVITGITGSIKKFVKTLN